LARLVSSDVNSAFWIAFICVVFMLPFAYAGVPWNKGFDWDFFNYTILTVGATFLLFGGWYVLSARKWFEGPIRQGTDEELERIERAFGEGGTSAPRSGDSIRSVSP
jgi:hypothetical protein